jgi:hypothetical protein
MAFILREIITEPAMNALARAPNPSPATVFELRQYTLHAGQRETLIELFEREFVDPQEALGITLPGLFRDLDDADRFVWLRGFPGMAARASALAAFYDGPVWRAHRDAANATMIDSDDVLLLRPVGQAAVAIDSDGDDASIVVIGISHFAAGVDVSARSGLLVEAIAPVLTDAGARISACYVSEQSANNYPRLPVREGENVFAWIAVFPSVSAHAACRDAVTAALCAVASMPAQKQLVLRLAPTSRSHLPLRQSGR